jgi:hypothetical protein
MRFFKGSSIVLFSLLFMWICIPHLSAKHHRHKHCSTSFSFNFNIAKPKPVYVPVSRPVYVERTLVRPCVPVVQERIYYPYYQPIIVERPTIGFSIQPQFSYYSLGY